MIWLYVLLAALILWWLFEPLPDPPTLRSLDAAAIEAQRQADAKGRRMLVWRTGMTYYVREYGKGPPTHSVSDPIPYYAASPEGMESTDEWKAYLDRLDVDRAARRAQRSDGPKKRSRSSLSRRIGG